MNVRDLKPGMRNVSVELRVISLSEPKLVRTGAGTERQILEMRVGDDTSSVILVLWDEKIIPVQIGDKLRIENGFVTSFKGAWRINVGKYSEVTKA